MQHESFKVRYDAVHCGTAETEIFFLEELSELFPKLLEPIIGRGIDGLPYIKEPAARRVFVTDKNIAKIPVVSDFLNNIDKDKHCVIVLEPGENNKTIESVLSIIQVALSANMQRNSIFTGIGGGVITDMTALAASLFKRGAQLELVPTTLLAMVDASIGGKTGCDFNDYKNMIGTFYPARRLFMAVPFITSLPESEYRSGLAEAFKTAMLYAPKLFNILEDNFEKVKTRDSETLMQIIKRCVQAKARIVEQDLTEKGPRMQLNLGHTFAHALETVAGLGAISHGDAVAWGLGRAITLSKNLGLCQDDYVEEVFSVLEKYGWSTQPVNPVVANIADSYKNANQSKPLEQLLLDAMKKDKKNSSNTVRCILQREMNSTVIEEVSDEDILTVLTE